MTARLAVVDHGAGNLVSISQALARCGATPQIAVDPSELAGCDGVVLPGVGSSRTVMEGVEQAGFTAALADLEVPLLGICVGMQILFDESEEDGTSGLGLLAGSVRRLSGAPTLPHIGWNDLSVRPGSTLFDGVPDPVVYFVHSFAAEPEEEAVVSATATHGRPFTAAVESGRIFGVQFHPERSGSTGLRILHRFVATCSNPGLQTSVSDVYSPQFGRA